MNDNDRINDIVIKAITDEELTSTESTILDQWLADAENRALLEKLKNKDYLLAKLIEAHKVDVEGDRVFLEQRLAPGKRIDITRHRKLFRDVATSAAAVLILAAATFFYFNTRKPVDAPVTKEKIKTVAQQDIAPGRTTALLTLADGSKVVVDSTATGQLAQQGGTAVVNENGTLKYEAKDQTQNEGLFNTLSTANGQTYGMVLADGSKVWLNAGASIRYPVAFTGNERIVEITGEAWFEVAHQASKPFIVHVSNQKGDGMDVQVLGTHFNINAYNDEDAIKTTLLQGSVKVKQGNAVTLLQPGQQAQVSNGVTTVLRDVNVDVVIAWKNGRFNFEKADITAVMRQLTKWYDIDVVYEGPKPAQLFTGEIERSSTLSQVLKVLEYTDAGVHFRVEGKKLIVISPEFYRSQQKDTNQL